MLFGFEILVYVLGTLGPHSVSILSFLPYPSPCNPVACRISRSRTCFSSLLWGGANYWPRHFRSFSRLQILRYIERIMELAIRFFEISIFFDLTFDRITKSRITHRGHAARLSLHFELGCIQSGNSFEADSLEVSCPLNFMVASLEQRPQIPRDVWTGGIFASVTVTCPSRTFGSLFA